MYPVLDLRRNGRKVVNKGG